MKHHAIGGSLFNALHGKLHETSRGAAHEPSRHPHGTHRRLNMLPPMELFIASHGTPWSLIASLSRHFHNTLIRELHETS